MVSTSRRALSICYTYDEVDDVSELEGILQRGGVLECAETSDGIVTLERNRSQEVDAAEDLDFRSDLIISISNAHVNEKKNEFEISKKNYSVDLNLKLRLTVILLGNLTSTRMID